MQPDFKVKYKQIDRFQISCEWTNENTNSGCIENFRKEFNDRQFKHDITTDIDHLEHLFIEEAKSKGWTIKNGIVICPDCSLKGICKICGETDYLDEYLCPDCTIY